MYHYDEAFYRYINEGAARSAGRVIPALLATLPAAPRSVLDVGCGTGAWLSVWKWHGVAVRGLDGDYVVPEQLLVAADEFTAADLARPFDLGRRFDLVQCLEVAEHLPAAAAPGLVDSLCRHADIVLFSAAPPGQGGENHLNERPYAYWQGLFAARGYAMFDVVRPAVAGDRQVVPWYRYNVFLYLNESACAELCRQLASARITGEHGPADVSPLWYRLRKRLVRALSPAQQLQFALWKKALFNTVARFRRAVG